jgi:hypothetical protein
LTVTLSTQDGKLDGEKLKDQSDEVTPKILEKVAENWGKRCHNIGERLVKYYHNPSSSTGECCRHIELSHVHCFTLQYSYSLTSQFLSFSEIVTDVKKSMSSGYDTTVRILSYCQPQEKAKQVEQYSSTLAYV